MRKLVAVAVAALCMSGLSVVGASAQVAKDASAPAFGLPDVAGKVHQLADYKGKWIVLEWFNPECPFVKKHYDFSGNMPKLQREYTSKGVIWLSICSSAPGKQGNFPAAHYAEWANKNHAAQTAILLDPDGKVGKAYGAKTTPHMFVINPDGKVVYQGAIDDKPTPDPKASAGAVNYVKAALDAGMAGKPIDPASTASYGCSVKY